MSTSVGTATGCVRGQRPLTAYAMWRLWSTLSRSRPFQQPGKVARRWSARFDGQFDTTADLGGAPKPPQPQPTTESDCGRFAFWLPAIMTNPGGKVRTCSEVRRT